MYQAISCVRFDAKSSYRVSVRNAPQANRLPPLAAPGGEEGD